MDLGAFLGGASEKDYARMQLQYLKATFEQNFIIIRQLDRLNNK